MIEAVHYISYVLLQELEVRLRHATMPGPHEHSHVTRGEHEGLLEQAVAARERLLEQTAAARERQHEQAAAAREQAAAAEAEAEAGRQARRAAWALQEREAELAAAHRQALHQARGDAGFKALIPENVDNLMMGVPNARL